MSLTEENNSKLSLSKTFLLFGLFGLFITGRKQFVDSYSGEPLKKEIATVSKIPGHVEGGKTTSRIQFNVNEHFSEFWIMNSGLEKYLEVFPEPENSMKLGDTVELYFLEDYTNKLTNPLNEIPIVGLKLNNKVILDPRQIEQVDRTWIFWGYVLSIILLVTGAIIYLIKRREFNSSLNQNTEV
jgi:hypothetical protein